MVKPSRSRRQRATPGPTPRSYKDAAAAEACVGCSLRLPAALLAKIDARVSALNAERRGRWSRNGYMVFVLESAVATGNEREK